MLKHNIIITKGVYCLVKFKKVFKTCEIVGSSLQLVVGPPIISFISTSLFPQIQFNSGWSEVLTQYNGSGEQKCHDSRHSWRVRSALLYLYSTLL